MKKKTPVLGVLFLLSSLGANHLYAETDTDEVQKIRLILEKKQASVEVIRRGRVLKDDKLKEDFLFESEDQIRVEEGAFAEIKGPSFVLSIPEKSIVQIDRVSEEGTPSVITVIYGHLRAKFSRDRKIPVADLLRIRTLNAVTAVTALNSNGVADYLVHVTKNEAEYFKLLDRVSEPAAPAASVERKNQGSLPLIKTLNETKIYKDLYTRINVFRGTVSFKNTAEGTEEQSISKTATGGQFLEQFGSSASKEQKPGSIDTKDATQLLKSLKLAS